MEVLQRTKSPGEGEKSTGLARQTTEGFVPSQDISTEEEGPDETVVTTKPRLRKTDALSQEAVESHAVAPSISYKSDAIKTLEGNAHQKLTPSQATEESEHQLMNHSEQRAARERFSIPLFTSSVAPAAKLSVTSEASEPRRLSVQTDKSQSRKLSCETDSSELRKISLATDDSELRKISFPTDSSELRKLSQATDDSELRKLSLLTDSSETGAGLEGRSRLVSTASSEAAFSLASPLVDEPDGDTVSRQPNTHKY